MLGRNELHLHTATGATSIYVLPQIEEAPGIAGRPLASLTYPVVAKIDILAYPAGAGGKLYQPGYSTADLGATAAAASPSTLPRGGKGKTAPNREQQQHHHHHQHHHRRGSEDRHHHGRPYMLRAELHKILTTDGEALTDEEVDELLRECRPDQEGRIVYEGYRRMLIDPSL